MEKISLVVTSISKPNQVLNALARGCVKNNWDFILVGDVSSPKDFKIDGCEYFDIERQIAAGFSISKICPVRHYARKNIGYLVAIRKGAAIIVETDDDNIPYDEFWQERQRIKEARSLNKTGWVNAYQYFSNANIWPRGLPLECIRPSHGSKEELSQLEQLDCPIQQGLADDNPDVDAVYRLVMPLPIKFDKAPDVALGKGTWCPFNSQNTTWWRDAFPLMYLPAYCSFRMTDIWRSFITQRIAWENNWSVLFHHATVYQERNEHNLMKDFADEVPGYLNNEKIRKILSEIKIKAGEGNIPDAMRSCYGRLIEEQVMDMKEMVLLEAWLTDLKG
jgi:hypothetical protein